MPRGRRPRPRREGAEAERWLGARAHSHTHSHTHTRASRRVFKARTRDAAEILGAALTWASRLAFAPRLFLLLSLLLPRHPFCAALPLPRSAFSPGTESRWETGRRTGKHRLGRNKGNGRNRSALLGEASGRPSSPRPLSPGSCVVARRDLKRGVCPLGDQQGHPSGFHSRFYCHQSPD